jgi:menaquinone-specific isochorismate synthase
MLERAGDRRRLVSVTTEVDVADPSAAVFRSRLASDRWFCWEQPDRDGFALAAMGSAHEAVSRGPGRFDDLVHGCAALARDRIADEPAGLPAGAGPVWVGGFAFDPLGCDAGEWSSFPPALMVLPDLALVRHQGRTLLTASMVSGPGADDALSRLGSRLGALRADGGLPMLDPDPAGDSRVVSANPPETYERAVAAAVRRILAEELEKVVLAREVRVEASAALDAAAIFGAVRELFPSCFCFCCGSPEAAFLGASPELLVRRRGAGGLGASQRRPGGRRPPRRAAPALAQEPRGARGRRTTDRAAAAPVLRMGRGGG